MSALEPVMRQAGRTSHNGLVSMVYVVPPHAMNGSIRHGQHQIAAVEQMGLGLAPPPPCISYAKVPH